jgi:predicted DNA-binding protein with PD1-like motif|nr:DNA-binding protein [Deltaproteobacteria bacterium]
MLVTSSQSVRSLVVRLNKGEDLAESLASLITSQRITVATVQGHGALEAVILDSYDARARTYGDARTFTGRLELISLQGHLSTREGHPDLYLHAAVARDTGNGVEVLGGRLIEAQVVAVELTLLLHDDLHLERTPETTGIPTWRTGSAVQSAPARPAPAPALATASSIAESVRPRRITTAERAEAAAQAPAPAPEVMVARRPAPTPEVVTKPTTLAEAAQQLHAMPAKHERTVDENVSPEVGIGDVLLHPTLGDAQVVGLNDDRCDIKLDRSGSVRAIMLDYFEVTPQSPRDGVKVWKLVSRKPR